MDSESINLLSESLIYNKNLPLSTDTKLTLSNNTTVHLSIRVDKYYTKHGSSPNYFMLMTDISHRKALEQRLNTMAYYDKLTALPNRQFFMHKLEKYVRDKILFALFFIDLDDFKIVNDTIGHDAGDKLLQIVSQRLRNCLSSNDTICRLGGDEFTLIVRKPDNKKQVEKIAAKIINKIRMPIALNSQKVCIGSSIGIVHHPEDSASTQDLLKKADMSMYEAKHSGKNRYRCFNCNMSKQIDYNLRIEADLHHIIQENQLQLHYQPIYSREDFSLKGFEALVRWIHPDRGIISPSDFISIAERIGVIIEIGQWVIKEACATLESWNKLGFNPHMAINISAPQLHKLEFVEDTLKTIGAYQIDPGDIILEFTENVLIEHQEEILKKLLTLKSQSIQLALDDFGTGCSSLSYLNYFPIDILKVDKSFINRIPNNPKACSIVSAIISLAGDLELDIIVEGIEKDEHINWLEEKNCNYLQGFYFSRPLPEQQARALLIRSSNNQSSPTDFKYAKPSVNYKKV